MIRPGGSSLAGSTVSNDTGLEVQRPKRQHGDKNHLRTGTACVSAAAVPPPDTGRSTCVTDSESRWAVIGHDTDDVLYDVCRAVAFHIDVDAHPDDAAGATLHATSKARNVSKVQLLTNKGGRARRLNLEPRHHRVTTSGDRFKETRGETMARTRHAAVVAKQARAIELLKVGHGYTAIAEELGYSNRGSA
jgi:hypothetical protein